MGVVDLPDVGQAYTVRPDIWPLGSNILVEAGSMLEVPAAVEVRAWVLLPQWEQEALAAGLAGPGVAEAHILAGQVSVRGSLGQ